MYLLNEDELAYLTEEERFVALAAEHPISVEIHNLIVRSLLERIVKERKLNRLIEDFNASADC